MQVLNIASLIELSNLKFGYKALHNLLPPITTNLCMSDSMNKKLSKEQSHPLPTKECLTELHK